MIGLAGPLVGMIVLLNVFTPEVRLPTFVLAIIVVIAFVGFAVYRSAPRLQRSENAQSDTDRPASPVKRRESLPETAPARVEKLRSIDWFHFERLVGLVYSKLGYTVNVRGGANPDGGIDLVMEKNGQCVAVQCKHWKTWNVGVRAMREFLGALTDAGIPKGIFITLGGYTGDAKQLAEKHGIEIINETDMDQMMEQAGSRFDPEVQALLSDTRKFCPKCEKERVLRTAKKGRGEGQEFWGCSAVARCRFTMPMS